MDKVCVCVCVCNFVPWCCLVLLTKEPSFLCSPDLLAITDMFESTCFQIQQIC